MGLDIAASSLFSNGKISITDSKDPLSGEQFGAFLNDLYHKYSLLSIEDPFGEEDWQSWTNFHSLMGKQVMIVGDDLLVTQKGRLAKAIETNACNAVLIKPNQVGTISETLQTIKLAKDNNMSVIISPVIILRLFLSTDI